MQRIASGIQANFVVAIASLVGLAGFFYPFLLSGVTRTDDRGAHAADAPLLFAVVTAFCLVAIAVDLGEQGSLDIEIKFSNWDGTVTIAAPPADQVTN